MSHVNSQWVENPYDTFYEQEVGHTTILLGGLTIAHNLFCQAALHRHGYHVQLLDSPSNVALRLGKEFGNRGQCNPTYYTVGNLINYLSHLRDEKGLSTNEIINNYIFLTASSCGPCRFGMYITEYRKALRDSGFEGFRVMTLSQTSGTKQIVCQGAGLKITAPFFIDVIKAILAGDVLNAMTFRIRPYELEAGSTNIAVERCREELQNALENGLSIVMALRRCKKILNQVKLDRSRIRPKVAVIGELWVSIIDGDANYNLHRFLEEEGAEVDSQLIIGWLLYLLWQAQYDIKERIQLREDDAGRYGLKGKPIAGRLLKLHLSEQLLHTLLRVFSAAIGLRPYKLHTTAQIWEKAKSHYNAHIRGGEGFLEVGRFALHASEKTANMTISIKPFGCMPSSSVSDGIQTSIMEKYPEAIFLPIETSGDGEVNVCSRIQMQLFRAKQLAKKEVESELKKWGLTFQAFQDLLSTPNNKYNQAINYPRHHSNVACQAANIISDIGRKYYKYRHETF